MDGKIKQGQETCTLDGTVDWHGRPAIRERSGTWVAGILILGNSSLLQCLCFMLFFSLEYLLINYLKNFNTIFMVYIKKL